ncbi:phosphotransferase family protein [Phenylobacterium montanum]|uniref:Phosphotransferase family protein n=1 Tax=Phenylobacterium montanum TaxID=2823693 RepID=A0A975G400_9CAUL|nr:phosphotransferase family protein [Caulobacter sp. S6]QUD90379.1 phosphotransferase family protein [Caulobacter sp. S6]
MAEGPRKYLGETVEVKTQHRIDEARLAQFLGDCAPGYAGPLRVRQFEGGQSNPTYLLTTPDAKYVLRRKPPGVLLKSAHAVDREYRVMRALWETGFPVPEPLDLCEDDAVLGTAFYVMRHVPGRVFLDVTMPDLSCDERAAVFDSMNATLARLHSLDHAAIGLGDFGRGGNYFLRQISRWSQQYEASKTADIPAMDKLIAWLPTAAPVEEETRLIHGDFSFHNVLVHPTEPRIVAVLDWELSTTGHPLGDLMYHGMEWYRPAGNDARGTLLGANLEALGVPSLEAYVALYCERIGRAPVENLNFHKAYNLFRVAAIVQGIVGRARDGTAAAAGAAEQAARVRPLAEAAWRFAQEGGAA